LLSKKGFYYTSAGLGREDFGNQKHPVQLNDLAFLPVCTKISETSLIAYNFRYKITKDAENLFLGWTLGEFLLAGSRVGNPQQWKKDWDNMRAADYVDADWIQIYESSGLYKNSFTVRQMV